MQTPTSVPGVRVERVVTAGGGLENNVWLIGNDEEVVVIDASWDAAKIVDVIAGREVLTIVCTHGHHDHINVIEELRHATSAPVRLHSNDRELWAQRVASPWDVDSAEGDVIKVAGIDLVLKHTPGHTPGACCVHAPALTTVFTGDTLFEGGPGATRWEYSSFAQIIESIREKLLTLPPETLVLTGHGPSTTIGREAQDLQTWIARGW